MRIFGFGKDLSFYTLLEEQIDAACRAAQEFQALAGDFSDLEQRARRIHDIEDAADGLTHRLANKVDATFVTPLDKEDLHALSSRLDDITDAIDDATESITLYQLTTPRPDLATFAGLLVQATTATQEAIVALSHQRGREAFNPIFIRIHQAENESDTAYRQALAELFNKPGADPLMVIKWKEVYDRIEDAVDKCEQAAHVIESVVVKYA